MQSVRRLAVAAFLVSIAPACSFEYPYDIPSEEPPPDAVITAAPDAGYIPEPPTAGAAYKSCLEIRNAGLSRGDGVYLVDTDGDGSQPAFDVYCDMTIAGGGWTLAGRSVRDQQG